MILRHSHFSSLILVHNITIICSYLRASILQFPASSEDWGG